MPDFHVSRESSDAVEIASVFGEIDLTTVGAIEEVLDGCANRGDVPVIADLSGVSFIDSIGLRTLIRARRRLERDERRFVIVAGQRAVRSVFELTRTDRQLDIVDTLEGALASVNGGG